jgi:hypothetical protein
VQLAGFDGIATWKLPLLVCQKSLQGFSRHRSGTQNRFNLGDEDATLQHRVDPIVGGNLDRVGQQLQSLGLTKPVGVVTEPSRFL